MQDSPPLPPTLFNSLFFFTFGTRGGIVDATLPNTPFHSANKGERIQQTDVLRNSDEGRRKREKTLESLNHRLFPPPSSFLPPPSTLRRVHCPPPASPCVPVPSSTSVGLKHRRSKAGQGFGFGGKKVRTTKKKEEEERRLFVRLAGGEIRTPTSAIVSRAELEHFYGCLYVKDGLRWRLKSLETLA